MDLVVVDEARIKQVIDTYYHWKMLDAEIRLLSGTRGINLPSEISEYIACYALDILVNKSSKYGDAVDLTNPDNPLIIEIKGSSAEKTSAPNSFSPSEEFDELVFIRLIKQDDVFNIYRTGFSSDDIKKIKVNKDQTLLDQQIQGRRPRFSIINEIIEKNDLTPDVIFDVRHRTIEKKDNS